MNRVLPKGGKPDSLCYQPMALTASSTAAFDFVMSTKCWRYKASERQAQDTELPLDMVQPMLANAEKPTCIFTAVPSVLLCITVLGKEVANFLSSGSFSSARVTHHHHICMVTEYCHITYTNISAPRNTPTNFLAFIEYLPPRATSFRRSRSQHSPLPCNRSVPAQQFQPILEQCTLDHQMVYTPLTINHHLQ